MPIDDEGRMTLQYAPSRYAELNSSAEGRWVAIPDIGTIWTDDQDGLGAVFSGSGDHSSLVELISDYNEMGATASMAFQALLLVYSADAPTSGTLSEMPAPEPVTAAGPPPTETGEVFAAFLDDKFVDVGRASPNGMYLRDKGEWQLLPDTDLRFDDTEWLPLDDAGVAKYDEAEKSGTTLARADVESPAPKS